MDTNPITLIIGTGAAVLIARTFYESFSTARGHSSAVKNKSRASKSKENRVIEEYIEVDDRANNAERYAPTSESESVKEFNDTLSLVDEKLADFATENENQSNVDRSESITGSTKLSNEISNKMFPDNFSSCEIDRETKTPSEMGSHLDNRESTNPLGMGSLIDNIDSHPLDCLSLARNSITGHETEDLVQLHACSQSHSPEESTQQTPSNVHVSVDIVKKPDSGVHVSVDVMQLPESGSRFAEHFDRSPQNHSKALECSGVMSERFELVGERGIKHLESNARAIGQSENGYENACKPDNTLRERYELIGRRSDRSSRAASEYSAQSEHGSVNANKRSVSNDRTTGRPEPVLGNAGRRSERSPRATSELSAHFEHGNENASPEIHGSYTRTESTLREHSDLLHENVGRRSERSSRNASPTARSEFSSENASHEPESSIREHSDLLHENVGRRSEKSSRAASSIGRSEYSSDNASHEPEGRIREHSDLLHENVGRRSEKSSHPASSAHSECGSENASHEPESSFRERSDQFYENAGSWSERSSRAASERSAHSDRGHENLLKQIVSSLRGVRLSTNNNDSVMKEPEPTIAHSEHGHENITKQKEFSEQVSENSNADKAQSENENDDLISPKLTSSQIDQAIQRSIELESLRNAFSMDHPGLVIDDFRFRPDTPANHFDPEHIRSAVETLCAIYNQQQKYNKDAKNWLLQINMAKHGGKAVTNDDNEGSSNLSGEPAFQEVNVFFNDGKSENVNNGTTEQIIDSMNEYLVGDAQDEDVDSNSVGSDSNMDMSEHTEEDEAREAHEREQINVRDTSNTTTSTLNNSLVIYVKEKLNDNDDSRSDGFEDIDVVSCVPNIFQNVIVRKILKE